MMLLSSPSPPSPPSNERPSNIDCPYDGDIHAVVFPSFTSMKTLSRREALAGMAMQALLTGKNFYDGMTIGEANDECEGIAARAVFAADALIAELRNNPL